MAVTTLGRTLSRRLSRALGATLLGGALSIGPMSLLAGAQQPSDPSGCGAVCTGGGGGGGTSGDVDVLGATFTKSQAGGGSGGLPLAKTGGDSALYLLASAGAGGGALWLRKAIRPT